MLWLKKHPPSFVHTALRCSPSQRRLQVVSLTHCSCLSAPEDWDFIPSVTNISWKRQWLRELLMSLDKQGLPWGLRAL